MSIVAVLDSPPESVTLTRKLSVPALAFTGVPERAPLLATVSQPAPLTFANTKVSPGFGSLAVPASELEKNWPAFATGSVTGLLVKDGAPFTVTYIVAEFDSPTESVALT